MPVIQCAIRETTVTLEYMILGNKSSYFVRVISVVIAIEQENISYIVTMPQWTNKVGYPTVINEKLSLLLYGDNNIYIYILNK